MLRLLRGRKRDSEESSTCRWKITSLSFAPVCINTRERFIALIQGSLSIRTPTTTHSSSTGAPSSLSARRRWSASPMILTTSHHQTDRCSPTSGETSRSRPGSRRLVGARRSERRNGVHRAAGRGRVARRRRRSLPCNDTQGEGVSANATSRPGLLPVSSASGTSCHRRGRGSLPAVCLESGEYGRTVSSQLDVA